MQIQWVVPWLAVFWLWILKLKFVSECDRDPRWPKIFLGPKMFFLAPSTSEKGCFLSGHSISEKRCFLLRPQRSWPEVLSSGPKTHLRKGVLFWAHSTPGQKRFAGSKNTFEKRCFLPRIWPCKGIPSARGGCCWWCNWWRGWWTVYEFTPPTPRRW